MSRLQISDPRSLRNLLPEPEHARWVRTLEIGVRGGANRENRLDIDLRRAQEPPDKRPDRSLATAPAPSANPDH